MKLVDISIKRKVTITMFTLAVILFGSVSFSRLKLNLLPELSYPTLTIRTEYPGAAPSEVENLLSEPLEETLGVVKNVRKISSVSRAEQSDVTIEFAWGTNMDFAGLEVREKIDQLNLPKDVKRPSILRYDPALEPIMRFGFYTENNEKISIENLRIFADEELKKDLEVINGVASVKISGGLEEQIHVLIDQGKLSRLNLNISAISNRLNVENINYSGGKLEEGTTQLLVRTVNEFKTLEDIENLVLGKFGGKTVYLRDVAKIRKSYKERSAVTRMEGKESIEIAIYKEGDANTVSVAKDINKSIEKIKKKLPKHSILTNVYNQSTFIENSINEVIKSGMIGGILAVFVLYFFLKNFWITIITSFSIPVSVIATFNLMYSNNITLNIMSLGGITLGIGMLLDNSIVVLENISRYREKGSSNIESARKGTSQVGMAVTASTLTTIAVFFPLIFVEGIAGQLFKDQAMTVTFSLLASLIVALTLIPMLASIQRKRENYIEFEEELTPSKSEKPEPTNRFYKIYKYSLKPIVFIVGFILKKIYIVIFNLLPYYLFRFFKIVFVYCSKLLSLTVSPFVKIFDIFYSYIEKIYPKIVRFALGNNILVLFIAITLFILSINIIPTLGMELIPKLTQGEFKAEIKMPVGTPLVKTDKVLKSIQDKFKSHPYLSTVYSVAGTGNRLSSNSGGGDDIGEVNFVIKKSYFSKEKEIMDSLRVFFSTIPGMSYKFSTPTLFSFKTPLEVEISGYNLKKIERANKKIVSLMEKDGLYTDIKTTVERGQPEIQIYFDRDRAAALGIKIESAARRITDKLKGDLATKFSKGDRKIDILVKANRLDFRSVDDIKNTIINPESRNPITLKSISNIVVNDAPGEIRRGNQQRVAIISSDITGGDLGFAAKHLEEKIGKLSLDDGIVVSITGQNEEMELSFRSLKFTLIMAIFLVYLVMASQFESFIHPFVILLTIPLAMIGAVFALYITGYSISVVVFIGAILLAGIVVNNAIVLIDLINQLRSEGMEKLEAIVEGGRLRLRSILMTTLTTTLGLLPLAIGIGEGSELRAPMAITVVGGLTVSTLLTLVVIPVVYKLLDRKKFVEER
ncbi:MAG: acriflavin resistance protein [Candidatus Cloacimonadota bacterium]|nr:MAG: acriflavin resistance protein [Candidatus Cloacimonadota bacterium]PIE81379.1 MAG: acriflavin resistance protein [Candidatus Delongbacteria bacterium]